VTETGAARATARKGEGYVRFRGGGHVAPSRPKPRRVRRRPSGRPPRFRRAGGTRRNTASMTAPARPGLGPSSVPGVLSPGKTIGTYRKDGQEPTRGRMGGECTVESTISVNQGDSAGAARVRPRSSRPSAQHPLLIRFPGIDLLRPVHSL